MKTKQVKIAGFIVKDLKLKADEFTTTVGKGHLQGRLIYTLQDPVYDCEQFATFHVSIAVEFPSIIWHSDYSLPAVGDIFDSAKKLAKWEPLLKALEESFRDKALQALGSGLGNHNALLGVFKVDKDECKGWQNYADACTRHTIERLEEMKKDAEERQKKADDSSRASA
jgi:hypothetical protein